MMLKYRRISMALGSLALVMVLAAFGCTDNGTTPVDEHDGTEELVFELTFGAPHLETLEAVTLELAIENHHGEHQTAFSNVEMQYRMEGATIWEEIPMIINGEHFAATHVFMTSGKYEMRVMGMEGHGDGHGDGAGELHHMDSMFEVHRAHVDAGGYRVEYESFPGHIHAGENSMLRFWVFNDITGAPINGLSASIRCTEDDGTGHDVVSTEPSAGVYDGAHIVVDPGVALISLMFTGLDSKPAEARFTTPVVGTH